MYDLYAIFDLIVRVCIYLYFGFGVLRLFTITSLALSNSEPNLFVKSLTVLLWPLIVMYMVHYE